MGLRLGFFYVVVYGSPGGSIMRVFPMGLLVSSGLRYRLLWFGSSGGSFLWAIRWV